jgi:hypothetical protein
MSDLVDSFAQLIGRQPSDKDKQDLYRVRDALKLKTTDSVWLLLMALQYYKALYEEFPARIMATASEVMKGARATAEAHAKAANAETRRALSDAVREAAVKSARYGAGAQLARWVCAAVGGIVVALLAVGWVESSRGYERGRAVGTNMATRACDALVDASSWATTPDGQLAYALAKAGSLGEVGRCSGRGMVPRDGWCTIPSERGKTLARWPMPAGSKSNGGGDRE